ncbi:MAG: flagellar biosynthetic protein FliO [Gammaproteobacteria bacterium]|jgi:flagellar protein FliO/FliZ|nr:MAG: flagellar biosynthetic protein FliO [Gammaproteobacteria bacterium]PHR81468.1 MAG: flagellar biosynthetic protein FliO [Colwellia sp.]
MPNFLCTFTILLLFFITSTSYAQGELDENKIVKQAAEILVADPLLVKSPPEVGKHVMANTDVGSMILSLLMVLALIGISAFVLKRFNVTQQNAGQLKVVASLSLGVKERLVVAQVGDQQLVLGVTSQQITLIKSLEKPISSQPETSSVLTGNVLAFLKKTNFKPKKT